MTPLARTVAVGRRRRLAAVCMAAGTLASDVTDSPASCATSSLSAASRPAWTTSGPAVPPGSHRGGGAATTTDRLPADAAGGASRTAPVPARRGIPSPSPSGDTAL